MSAHTSAFCAYKRLLIVSLTLSARTPLFTGFWFSSCFQCDNASSGGGTNKRPSGAAVPRSLARCRWLATCFCESLHIASIRADMYSLPACLISIGLHLFCLSMKRSIMILCSLYKWTTKRIGTPTKPPSSLTTLPPLKHQLWIPRSSSCHCFNYRSPAEGS